MTPVFLTLFFGIQKFSTVKGGIFGVRNLVSQQAGPFEESIRVVNAAF